MLWMRIMEDNTGSSVLAFYDQTWIYRFTIGKKRQQCPWAFSVIFLFVDEEVRVIDCLFVAES